MTSVRVELPPEGDEEEAQRLASKGRSNVARMPTYRLERVNVSVLQVDYAPPYGDGYARPLSEYRLRQLRKEWDPLAVSPMTISRRGDGSLWLLDGNHRRVVAFENGINQLPAMVHSGLERWQEADLYYKLGVVLGQTPWTRFQAKLVAGSVDAANIVRIAQRYDMTINGLKGQADGVIQAVARVEWIMARGGAEGLNWVLAFIDEAFDGAREALGELQLEGAFGFYLRYADKVDRSQVATLMGAGGVYAWHDRAQSIYNHADYGPRSNTFGVAIAEVVNEAWRKQGKAVKDLLPAWDRNAGRFGQRYTETPFSRHAAPFLNAHAGASLVPQQLEVERA